MGDKEYKRSRFAGMPGSVAAIRVDYSRRLTAFDPPAPDTHIAEVKREVRRWKLGHRLGDKVEWDGAAPDEKVRLFPRRPLMHQLSEFQAVKLNYNYRAATLPRINHDTLYVAKPSKLEVDRRIFLTPQEKSRLVDRCPATVTNMSLFEIKNDPKQLPTVAREGGWNASTALPIERSSVHPVKPRAATGGSSSDSQDGGGSSLQPMSFLAINKTKGILNYDTYVSPRSRVDHQMQSIREAKLAARGGSHGATTSVEASGVHASEGLLKGVRHSAGSTNGGSDSTSAKRPAAFTMSNIDQWLGVPQEVAHLRTMLGNSQQAIMAAQAASAAAAAQQQQGNEGGGGVSLQSVTSMKIER